MIYTTQSDQDLVVRLEEKALELCRAFIPEGSEPEKQAAIGMDGLIGAAMRFASEKDCSPFDFVWGLRQFAAALEESIVRRAQAQMEDVVGVPVPGDDQDIDVLASEAEDAMKDPTGA